MENKPAKKKTTKSKKAVATSEKKDVQKENRNNDNVNVPIPLGFLKHINNIVLIANQRAHWQPNELIPVGTVLRELDGLIKYYNSLEVTNGKSSTGTTESPTSS
jgi:hypothetical protein